MVHLDEPLRRCFLAGEGNTFIQTILRSIPNLARERGIYSLTCLERMFDKVAAECTGVTYTTTQPMFTRSCDFHNGEGMTDKELLTQAKYFLRMNCLPEAVRCMVHLSEAKKEIAQDWIDEARLILVVRQASETLMAYAYMKSMSNIF